MDAAAKFRSMQANARVIKHYRSKVMKCITDSIQAKFDEVYAANERNPAGFLDDLVFIYKDLIRIESDVVPCFPPSYEIWKTYVREYHKALNNTITRLVKSEPEASVLLTLHVPSFANDSTDTVIRLSIRVPCTVLASLPHAVVSLHFVSRLMYPIDSLAIAYSSPPPYLTRLLSFLRSLA